jgi:hypothetical protein
MIPLTGIYVVINVYMAIANFRSANAAQSATTVMAKTVEEMQRQTNTMYSPSFSFPDGYRCWRKSDGSLEIKLANLGDHPAFDLYMWHWEMETNASGERSCKSSTLCESVPQTLGQHVLTQTFTLIPSKRADVDKTKLADLALSDFKSRFNGQLPSETLCVVAFSTKVSLSTIYYLYNLEMVMP